MRFQLLFDVLYARLVAIVLVVGAMVVKHVFSEAGGPLKCILSLVLVGALSPVRIQHGDDLSSTIQNEWAAGGGVTDGRLWSTSVGGCAWRRSPADGGLRSTAVG